ncbi:hypothetical protein E2C01_017562 [Portunus trituberculatus]|uniref:Uncharacterized protein n=1 Tax=Portunus trituberculatus TaxID=210409 RepID=A0A5B7DS88_PORTR|nr:hypothetical protein [Portunus trituberculatus]
MHRVPEFHQLDHLIKPHDGKIPTKGWLEHHGHWDGWWLGTALEKTHMQKMVLTHLYCHGYLPIHAVEKGQYSRLAKIFNVPLLKNANIILT